MRAPPLRPDHLLKVPSSILLDIRISTYGFWGGHKHSAHSRKSSEWGQKLVDLKKRKNSPQVECNEFTAAWLANLSVPHVLPDLTCDICQSPPASPDLFLTNSQWLCHIIWWNCVLSLTKLIHTGSYASYLLSDRFNTWMNFQIISEYLYYHPFTGFLSIPLWLSNNFKIDFWSTCGLSYGVLKDGWEWVFRNLF